MPILIIKEKRSEKIDGTVVHLLNFCKELNRRNIEYYVLYNFKDYAYNFLKKQNINILQFNFPKSGIKDFLNFKKKNKCKNFLNKFLIHKNITKIICYTPYLLGILPKINKHIKISCFNLASFTNDNLNFLNKKNFSNPRSFINFFYYKYVYFNYEIADIIICPGNDSAKSVKYLKENYKEKIKILFNFSDLRGFKNKSLLIKKYNRKKKIIVGLGRFTIDKGAEDFCIIAKKQNELHNCKFIYVAPFDKKNLLFRKRLVNEYKKYVSFVGYKKNMRDIFKNSNLFLFLSRREAFPLVCLESMRVSTPIIGWNTVGVRDVVKNNENGYLSKIGDYENVSKNLSKILDNEILYRKFSINSYNFSKKFTPSIFVNNLKKLKSI